MKYFKKLIVILFIVFITGCTNKELTNSYNKMVIGSKGINSYRLDLRVYGTVNNNYINEIVKVMNNKNEYEIKITIIKNKDIVTKEKTNYIKNDKIYIQSGNDYVVTNKDIEYSDPSLYLEGIKNIKKINKQKKEEIGEYLYSVYEIIVKKDFAKQLLESTTINGVKINKDIEAKVYIDKDGYVYRIIYYINDITINANYYGINASNNIMLPAEIK